MSTLTAVANPNIAFIKYWGNLNDALRLPANGSISMNLAGLETRTSVQFDSSLPADEVIINGKIFTDSARTRVSKMLDEVRSLAGLHGFARVESDNNFPTGSGIASSASAFAALAVAASAAAGLGLDPAALSRLARHGSGSACRSIPGGFVEWIAGTGDDDSFAVSIAPPEHWELTDCIAVISTAHKTTGSTEGHALAGTSPLQPARVADAPRRLDICRSAILNRDFEALAEVTEMDSNLMHAVMMTSIPPLFYWQPATLAVMHTVTNARTNGIPACYTIDAGTNVHIICETMATREMVQLVGNIPGVQNTLLSKTGGPARLV
jgi:diphosphomevalonate decarboxylase